MSIKKEMSETKSKENGQRRAPPKMTPSQFVVKNFDIPRIVEEKATYSKGKDGKSEAKQGSGSQYTLFPKYTYSQSSGEDNSKADAVIDTLCVLTPPIEIKKGGLQKVDGEWRKTEEDCKSAWLPLQEEFGGKGAVELAEMLAKIDKHIQDKMKKNPTDFLSLKSGNSETPLGKLAYNPLVRLAEAPAGVKDFVPWQRTKIVIPQKDGKIAVKLIVPGDDGEQIKKLATTIGELREDFSYGCTARFYLKFQTFWVLKGAKKGERECGLKVVCDMINIVEKSKFGGKATVEWDDLLGNEEKPTKQPTKETKKVAAKANSEKSSSDSDNDNADTKSDASDAESDASEPEPPKKETKKTKEPVKETKKTKKGSKKDASDSDESDDDNKKPAKGKSKSK